MAKESTLKFYGVLGYPAKHSLSPSMHNAVFRHFGINAEYRIFEKKPEELKEFLPSLFRQRIYGLNVTVPYKETVIPFLERISKEAKLIGAVNTIKVDTRNMLEGFNTDGEGFLRHLSEDLHFAPAGKNIALIGAGGAARAIGVYLAKQRPKRVSIYDVDKDRLASVVAHLQNSFKDIRVIQSGSIEGLDIAKSDLLINATPVGMKKDDPCLVRKELIHEGLFVYDLIYNPAETLLLRCAKERGASVSNGLGMLLHQGMLSFEIWTGLRPPKDIMSKALEFS